MKSILASLFLLTSFPVLAVETRLVDSEGRPAWLYTPSETPDPAKTYWLAVGVHGAGGDGKGACGIAEWAEGNVIVLGPTFVEKAANARAPGESVGPPEIYQMAGPAHVAKLKALIAEVGKTWKLHPKVYVHGFSAGAQFAHRLAMKEPELVGGVFAGSAGSWSTRGHGVINPAARGIPFAISCGDFDRAKSGPGSPLTRIEWMKEFAAELEEACHDVEARVIENNGHELHEDALELSKSCFHRMRSLAFSRTAVLALDFNGANPLWDLTAEAVQTPAGHNVTALAGWEPVGGMVETRDSHQGGGALRLEVGAGPAAGEWGGILRTGLLPVRMAASGPELLTLSFDLQASAARPVEVTIESFDAAKKRTGGLTGTAIPAAPGFYHRHALDLGDMTAAGDGRFQPGDPFVRISFRIGHDLAWPAAAGNTVRIDNLSYAAPAYFVSPSGDDVANDGRTAERPLATVQKAVDRARAGDVILVMDGNYESDRSSIAHIAGSGTPAAWLVLRAHPGHRPVFRSNWWDCVKIGQGSKAAPSAAPASAYIELRDLTIHGRAAEVEEKFKEKIGKAEPETNGNGISLDGRFQTEKPHHIRVAGCTVFECPGGGISAIHVDRVSLEDNHTHGNCRWMIYAGSGISVYQTFNFENRPDEYRVLVRHNRTHDNLCTQPWVATGKLSDGNGLIVDDLRNTQNESPNGIYHGRVLVQGNVSYRNGGSGMHAFSSDRVDFIHNTAAGNNLKVDYAQIGVTRCTDCRLLNNIMVAAADKAVSRVNGNSHGIVFSHNLIWGGNGSYFEGGRALKADPLFVDPEGGDFRLKSGSPALHYGAMWPALPVNYQTAAPRPPAGPPDLGALPAAP